MAIQWPRVKAQILAVLPTLAGWQDIDLYNGPPVGDGTADSSVSVGWVPGNIHSGSGSTTQSPDGFLRIETGQVLSRLACAVGDDDLAAVEATAFDLMDVVDDYIRANRTLGGVLSPEGTSDFSFEVLPAADGNTSVTVVDFTITYSTVT